MAENIFWELLTKGLQNGIGELSEILNTTGKAFSLFERTFVSLYSLFHNNKYVSYETNDQKTAFYLNKNVFAILEFDIQNTITYKKLQYITLL